MSKQPNDRGSDDTRPSNRYSLIVLGDIADTTWRMFVPTLAGVVGGSFADQHLGTTPWLFAAGTVLGCVIAGLLVRNQLRKQL